MLKKLLPLALASLFVATANADEAEIKKAMEAKLGAKVVISSRKADACQEVAEGINKAGGDAHVIPCNISRREEVEALISRHPKVQATAALPIPAAVGSEDDIVAFGRTQLAGFKTPKKVAWADALPRNPSGKILKKDLKALFRDPVAA